VAGTIDLGDRWEPPADTDGPGGLRPGRPVLAAALALLVLTTATAATAPPELRLRLAVQVGSADLRLDGDTLYRRDDRDGGITAYRLGRGTVTWRAAGEVHDVGRVGAATLLFSHVCPDGEVSRVDPGSGAVRWRRPGRSFGIAGTVVVVEQAPGSCDEDGADPAPGERALLGLSAADGNPRWRLVLPAEARVVGGGGPTTAMPLVAVAQDGRVRVLDGTTGAERVTAALADPDPDPDRPVQPTLQIFGDTLVAEVAVDERTRVTGYALGDLRPRWEQTFPADGSGGAIFGCEPYLCLAGLAGLRLLDPQTGLPVTGARPVPQRTGGWLLGTGPRPPRPATVLPGFLPVGHAADGALLVARYRPTGTLLVRYELGTGQRRMLGAPPGVYLRCLADVRHLACVTLEGELRVWRILP
jgi:hypothetical protein